MPIVDGRIELQAGIGAGPSGITDTLPQIARLDGLRDAAIGARFQIPIAVGSSTAFRKASVTRTLLLEFWPETVA